MSAKIKITNKGYLMSRNIFFDIYCDGKMIGTMNKYTIINFDKSGTYTLQAKAKYWETPIIIVKVDERKILNLRIKNKNKYFGKLHILMLIAIPVLPFINIFFHAKWFQTATIIILGAFISLFFLCLLFKRKDVWVLEDDNE